MESPLDVASVRGREFTFHRSDFELLARLVRDQMGIILTWDKVDFVIARLESYIKEAGFRLFADYVRSLSSEAGGPLIIELANRISTNFTFFYREPDHFELLRTRVLRQSTERIVRERGERALRVWCAASSTGEEPYTIAITMKEFFSSLSEKWDTGVLATDISERALSVATRGEYAREQISSLPESWQKRYFLPKPGSALVEVEASIKKEVLFRRFNLVSSAFQFKRPFDIIFCRNVMIYFDEVTRARLIDRFHQSLAPGGYLMVGHAEPMVTVVLRADKRFASIQTSTFQRIS